jgi:hypothetical protein
MIVEPPPVSWLDAALPAGLADAGVDAAVLLPP